MTITKNEIKEIQAQITDVLRAELAKHGLELTDCNCRYSKTNVDFTVKSQKAGLSIEETPEGAAFVRFAELYDLSPDMLGKEFTSGKQRFKIVGLNTAAPKRPVMCVEVGTDRKYGFMVKGLADLVS